MNTSGPFAGRFELLEELGRGAAARVLRAHDRRLDRVVALKLLAVEGLLAETQRFLDEARVLADLRHPHILGLLDYGVAEGQHYLVLEHVGGGTLETLRGKIGERRALALATQVMEALRAGHERGVLHRDVKPANVLLTREGEARLADFGLAEFSGRLGHTATGLVLGTPEYMAPELFRGEPASERSDVFSWGCLLHDLLTGRPPVTGTVGEIADRLTRGDWRPPALPGMAGALLAAALAPDAGERRDAERMLALLARAEGAPGSGSAAAPGGRPSYRGGPSSVPGAGSRPLSSDSLTRRMSTGSREASTRFVPVSTRAPAATRASRWVVVPVVLGLAAAAGWVLTGGNPADPGTEAVSPEVRVARWTGRARELDARAWIRDTQAGAEARLGPARSALNVTNMWNQKEGGKYEAAGVHVAARARALPFREALDARRVALAGLLGDGAVAFEVRWDLYRALQQFGHVDAYLSAWGVAPVYRFGPLLEGLVPIQVLALDPSWEEVPDPPTGPPPPGRFRLHRWPADWRPIKYVLVPNPEQGNQPELLAWAIAGMDPIEHAGIFGEVDLGTSPSRRYGGVHLEMTIANLVPPNMLRVIWNGHEVQYRTPEERVKRGSWKFGAYPDHRVRITLDPGMLREGRNTLKILTRPTPGLEHSLGLNIDLVGLVLDSPTAGPAGAADSEDRGA